VGLGTPSLNAVTQIKSTDPDPVIASEQSFWEVETSSLRDFPQQLRLFEIVRNSDNNISIITTNVDTLITDASLAATSRSYGIAAQEFYKNPVSYLPVGSYNAELVKQLSSHMQGEIQKYGTPIGN
jgi:hypothetical protein